VFGGKPTVAPLWPLRLLWAGPLRLFGSPGLRPLRAAPGQGLPMARRGGPGGEMSWSLGIPAMRWRAAGPTRWRAAAAARSRHGYSRHEPEAGDSRRLFYFSSTKQKCFSTRDGCDDGAVRLVYHDKIIYKHTFICVLYHLFFRKEIFFVGWKLFWLTNTSIFFWGGGLCEKIDFGKE